jgi:ribosomal protein L11 methylase PrmA
VSESLAALRPKWVLDIGANTGEFSARAAAAGASVVAIDTDEAAVNNMLHAAERNKHSILPLVGDFANPSPAVGWSNRERASFLSRAERRFDVVMLLAVVHHLRVTCGVPLAQIVRLVADLTRHAIIIEHVPVEDPMFKRLSRGRDELYADCQRSEFERALRAKFDLEKSQELPNGRTLYLATKRA